MRLAAILIVLLGAGPTVTPVPVPGGNGGIGFDDLGYSRALDRVLVPAGRTGQLDLIDPKTLAVTTIRGISQPAKPGPGHFEGTTSVDVGPGLLFASDRDGKKVRILDAKTHAPLGSASLEASPDYVRWVAPLKEVWVTEPGKQQVERFRLRGHALRRAGVIPVPGGPESLVIDAPRGRAYVNTWHGETVAIALRTGASVARWKNGCEGSRGLALDAQRGWLFVGCAEGKATALDVRTGEKLSEVGTGAGVDIIAYAPGVAHLYVPGGRSATLTVVAVGAKAGLTVLTTVPTAPHAHCVTTDGSGLVFVCDPGNGRLLRIEDLPAGQ